MKPSGLMVVLGKGLPSKGGSPEPEAETDEPAEDSAGESTKQYADLVVSALKSGDDEAASNALVSMFKACK